MKRYEISPRLPPQILSQLDTALRDEHLAARIFVESAGALAVVMTDTEVGDVMDIIRRIERECGVHLECARPIVTVDGKLYHKGRRPYSIVEPENNPGPIELTFRSDDETPDYASRLKLIDEALAHGFGPNWRRFHDAGVDGYGQ